MDVERIRPMMKELVRNGNKLNIAKVSSVQADRILTTLEYTMPTTRAEETIGVENSNSIERRKHSLAEVCGDDTMKKELAWAYVIYTVSVLIFASLASILTSFGASRETSTMLSLIVAAGLVIAGHIRVSRSRC